MSKVINGVVVLDGGQLLLDDKPVHLSSPQAAKNLGIATVFQELSLVPQMTVAENIWLTREPMTAIGTVNRKLVNEKTEELLSLFRGTYKTELHPDDPVASCPRTRNRSSRFSKRSASIPGWSSSMRPPPAWTAARCSVCSSWWPSGKKRAKPLFSFRTAWKKSSVSPTIQRAAQRQDRRRGRHERCE
jgi:ABC-type sugar transport system ATPase subunit